MSLSGRDSSRATEPKSESSVTLHLRQKPVRPSRSKVRPYLWGRGRRACGKCRKSPGAAQARAVPRVGSSRCETRRLRCCGRVRGGARRASGEGSHLPGGAFQPDRWDAPARRFASRREELASQERGVASQQACLAFHLSGGASHPRGGTRDMAGMALPLSGGAFHLPFETPPISLGTRHLPGETRNLPFGTRHLVSGTPHLSAGPRYLPVEQRHLRCGGRYPLAAPLPTPFGFDARFRSFGHRFLGAAHEQIGQVLMWWRRAGQYSRPK